MKKQQQRIEQEKEHGHQHNLQQQMQQQTEQSQPEQTKRSPEPVQLPKLDLYMEVETMLPPRSFSLKREKEEEEKKKVKNILKRRVLGEVGQRSPWVKLSVGTSLFRQQEQKQIRSQVRLEAFPRLLLKLHYVHHLHYPPPPKKRHLLEHHLLPIQIFPGEKGKGKKDSSPDVEIYAT